METNAEFWGALMVGGFLALFGLYLFSRCTWHKISWELFLRRMLSAHSSVALFVL